MAPPSTPRDQAAAEIEREAREKKATKSDKAPVPEYLWVEHMIADDPTGVPWKVDKPTLMRWMEWMRDKCLRKWKVKLVQEWWTWMKHKHSKRWKKVDRWSARQPSSVLWNPSTSRYEWSHSGDGKGQYQSWFERRYRGNKDFHAGSDALYRGVESTWWDWKAGSRPFFWRWKPELQEEIRDGMMVCFLDAPPDYTKPQSKHRDPDTKALVEEKLQKVLDRGYLDNGEVIVSLTSFFDVPKGESDIRMVYDGTKCGLNRAV